MKNFSRKISWVTLIATISVMALLYICPMEMAGSGKLSMAAAVHNSCENTPASAGTFSLSKFNSTGDCANARLALVGQTLKNLTGASGSFYLMMVLSVLVIYFFTRIRRNFLTGALRSFLIRAQYLRRRYRASTRFLVEKKLRRYLSLLGNYTVVSIG